CHIADLVLASTQSYSSLSSFTATATTDIYTLSLHDALPISDVGQQVDRHQRRADGREDPFVRLRKQVHALSLDEEVRQPEQEQVDRKSTRLNSSHVKISYAVFCLKKKKTIQPHRSQVQLPQT